MGENGKDIGLQADGIEKPLQFLFVDPSHGRDIHQVDGTGKTLLLQEHGKFVFRCRVMYSPLLQQIAADGVVNGVIGGSPDLGLEAFAVNRQQSGIDLGLDLQRHAIDVITDDAGHAARYNGNSRRTITPVRLDDSLFQLRLAAADDVGLIQGRGKPDAVFRLTLANIAPHPHVGVLGVGTGTASQGAMQEHHVVRQGIEHG